MRDQANSSGKKAVGAVSSNSDAGMEHSHSLQPGMQRALYAFDIEPDLIGRLQMRAKREAISNIVAGIRDFVANGTGLGSGSHSHAMIYNLLHIESPDGLIREAHRILHPNGRLSVIHWRSDIPTPRGPSLEIRPAPEQCKAWIEASGFRDARVINLRECCQFHFGIVATP
jgi:hypothetical protein